MRPASEIHSALGLLSQEAGRNPEATNLQVARDVLRWVIGERAPDDGPTLWLVGYLLDDPPKPEDVDPRSN